ncbi:hypothetical protein SCB49_13705 [unidentified eubacterium SCB49]|nr:hypothetical protein SCB49_13705 [unidentified eubacterium SCB49]
MRLSEKISKNLDEIKKYLYCGYASWDGLIDRIKGQEINPKNDFTDEQIWTFIIACGYAITGKNGLKKISYLLTNRTDLTTEKIWFEVLPSSPRDMEGSTHLDLAIGDIAIRKGTGSGIELNDTENSWISFCEMKWYSDISHNVSYDQHRNQLARVIENALLFKNENNYAKKVFVNLVTPGIFKNLDNKSRMYCYKFQDYKKSLKVLESDIKNCKLDYKNSENKNYIDKRIPILKLNWTTFDSLFESLPESDISNEIREFEKKYNKAK